MLKDGIAPLTGALAVQVAPEPAPFPEIVHVGVELYPLPMAVERIVTTVLPVHFVQVTPLSVEVWSIPVCV